jgi:hypothetical protein
LICPAATGRLQSTLRECATALAQAVLGELFDSAIPLKFLSQKFCFFHNEHVYSCSTSITAFANKEKGLESLVVKLSQQFSSTPLGFRMVRKQKFQAISLRVAQDLE